MTDSKERWNVGIYIVIGVISGVIFQYLASSFVSNDWSLAVTEWKKMARFMLIYLGLVGGILGAWWRFRP